MSVSGETLPGVSKTIRLATALSRIDSISERIGKAASFLLLPMVGALVYEVVSRYVFHSPTIWSADTSVFLSGAVALLTGAWVTKLELHINFDLVHCRLTERGRAVMDVVTAPFFFLVTGVLTWQLGEMAWKSLLIRETTSSMWAPPYYPFKIMLAVAALLTFIQGTVVLLRKVAVIAGAETK